LLTLNSDEESSEEDDNLEEDNNSEENNKFEEDDLEEDNELEEDDKSEVKEEDNNEEKKVSDESENSSDEETERGDRKRKIEEPFKKSKKKNLVDGGKNIKSTNVETVEEDERQTFRQELSKMSIEEIQKLKEKIGLKIFNQSLGISKPSKVQDFKRANKNRPREMSSKKTVARFREVVPVVKQEKRDPRFDPLCGDFDVKIFTNSYKFVNDIKSQELQTLKKELENEENPERKAKIKFLIQRIKNQQREERKREEKVEEKKVETKERKELLKTGKKPFVMSKAKKKEFDLAATYEKLKETGGLDNYIKKKTKKNVAKDRKMLSKLQ